MNVSVVRLVIVLSFLRFTGAEAQLLRGLDKAIANKIAFNHAVNRVEEGKNRFFYKKSNSGYIFTGTDSDLDGDHKSYMDLRFSADTITANVFTYQMSSEKYVLSETIHGKRGKDRTRYKHLAGDIYVALEDFNTAISGTTLLKTYLLYNPERGVYFHRFIYRQERKNLSTQQDRYLYIADGQVNTLTITTQRGEKYYYVNGSGLYKPSKNDKLTEQELDMSKDPTTHFDSLVSEAYQKK